MDRLWKPLKQALVFKMKKLTDLKKELEEFEDKLKLAQAQHREARAKYGIWEAGLMNDSVDPYDPKANAAFVEV